MKLLGLKAVSLNNFLHTYAATYLNNDGDFKEYEIISRNKKLKISDIGNNDSVDAVGMILFNDDKSKILLQKEFRLACNEWVYNFPGGLIDKGETVEQAAKRELIEETGLELYRIEKKLCGSYTAVGISNEKVATIVGYARGTFARSSSANEEIEAGWYTKEDIRELIEMKAPMSLRTQSFLYLWSLED